MNSSQRQEPRRPGLQHRKDLPGPRLQPTPRDPLKLAEDPFGPSGEARGGRWLCHCYHPEELGGDQQARQPAVREPRGCQGGRAQAEPRFPAHVSKTVQPYVEKLQKGASDVSAELAKKDVPIHAKAQKIIGITKRSAPDHSTTPSRRSGPSSTTTRSRSRALMRTARTEPSLPRNSSRNTLRAMSAMLRPSRSRRTATLRPFTRAAALHSAKRSVADPHIRRDGSPRRSDHSHPTTQSVRLLIHGLVPGSNAASGSPVSGKISPTQTERSDPPSPSRLDTLL